MGRRHVVVVVDRETGLARSASVHLPSLVGIAIATLCLPLLIGLGAELSAHAELAHLRFMRAALEEENANYRSVTDTFTEQIRALAGVVGDLQPNGDASRASVIHQAGNDRATRAATRPGPTPPALVAAAVLPSFATPGEIYDVLGGVLRVLTNGLPSIERSIRSREELAAAAPAIWPAEGWLTAPFGERSNPLTGEPAFHEGIDISASEGEPVHATADGIVEAASYAGDFGNLVVVGHAFGISTRYAHLSRFAVRPGVMVTRGDVVGYVGATGRATGAHVHYEVLIDDKPINPLQVLTNPARRQPEP
jgi:murein DD-endopeptidase MepM/ murein hydrolase activator NlpD